MKKHILFLLALSVFIAGCTTATNSTNSTVADSDAEKESEMEKKTDDEKMEEVKDSKTSEVEFNNYENRAIGYSINIPANWYYRHYYKTEIGDLNPTVEDYLFVSPTKSITGIQTESPAEVVLEISSRDINDFKDSLDSEEVVTIAGVEGILAKGKINNETFSDYQKIEYRFVKNGKTYRLSYIAPSGLSNNEELFRVMVDSLRFN